MHPTLCTQEQLLWNSDVNATTSNTLPNATTFLHSKFQNVCGRAHSFIVHTPCTLPVSFQLYLLIVQLEISTPVPSPGIDKFSEPLYISAYSVEKDLTVV